MTHFIFIFISCFFFSNVLFALTLEEKAGQLLIVHFKGDAVNADALKLIAEGHVGGFIYYNWSNGLDSPEQVRILSRELQASSPIHLWICIDQEGGPVARLKQGFPPCPGNREIAQSGDPETAKQAAYNSGCLLRSVGINMNLAPVADVSLDPESSYMASRTFGDTPEIVTRFAQKALEGFHQAGIVAVLKHFPGYGSVQLDPHAALPITLHTRETLDAVDLFPFKQLADQTDAIMMAHILAPALDPIHCATLSQPIIEGILRSEMGFQGLVISDSIVMRGLLNSCGSLEEAAIQAINAGCDLLILGGKQLQQQGSSLQSPELTVQEILNVHQAIIKAVQIGQISQERLEAAVERSLTLKQRRLQ